MKLSKKLVFKNYGIKIEIEMAVKNQNGFIPMLITLIIIMAVVIVVVYTRVHNAQN